ncbi:putative glycoside hydrolase [Staphylococcus sp. SQ8-PEA]|uniref:Glycoside hydrolase n=1 Tax=Staphylococcus marylandisciuri TaxID=2981529 RepID=A0ABT2QSH9_9STAP|nr:putative glycoside hydrolase [Staphylococcus marylandisciuri]MCU5746938.1 putative glycoside hydrolase [Staphylococcus marylandisciuri]
MKRTLTALAAGLLLLSACDNQTDSKKNSSSTASQDSQNYKVTYPKDGVKGIYVAPGSLQGKKFDELIHFINHTELNAMVIDVKDDTGNITMDLNSSNKLIKKNTSETVKLKKLMKTLKDNHIYSIARIVTFKDSKLAEEHPEWSFKQKNGDVWQSDGGDKFINPFSKEVQDYNIAVAKAAGQAGFSEVQFDYVRFPEGFENMDEQLDYTTGSFKENDSDHTEQRVKAITGFLKKAHEELHQLDVKTGADVFGYSATVKEAPGIGQSFPKIASNVDIISSMIYPSHWSPNDFGLAHPDLEPYKTVDKYLEKENEVLKKAGKHKPQSRPWLQDFTASYLGAGNYKEYDAKAVEDQIRALKDHGINEFLLWDASNDYTKGVDYTPDKSK